MDIAIVAVAYNRIDSISRLLSSLEKAYYPERKNVTLIISVDKSDTDVVENYADKYQWKHGKKIVDKHEKNLGLRPHMMSLGKWFDFFDALVVLEDDIVVSPNFYFYSCQTVEKYITCSEIAGISLYSFNINYQTGLPFCPLKDENDVYFMNCAMSWGEVWMRDSWQKFYNWYKNHVEFPSMPHLPQSICSWNDKSWLKYHTRYCIEENKYFVHPYNSLTTNYGDAGEHRAGNSSILYQVSLQFGKKETFTLPDFGDNAVLYDGFFENKCIYKVIGKNEGEICVDLQGECNNRLNCRYWLTTRNAKYKLVKSFGLNFRPIELNVILNNKGTGIFLYDTTILDDNNKHCERKALLYPYQLDNVFSFINKYGLRNTLLDFIEIFKRKIHL